MLLDVRDCDTEVESDSVADHSSRSSSSLYEPSSDLYVYRGWSLGGVGSDRGLRGGGRREWCEEWASRG